MFAPYPVSLIDERKHIMQEPIRHDRTLQKVRRHPVDPSQSQAVSKRNKTDEKPNNSTESIIQSTKGVSFFPVATHNEKNTSSHKASPFTHYRAHEEQECDSDTELANGMIKVTV